MPDTLDTLDFLTPPPVADFPAHLGAMRQKVCRLFPAEHAADVIAPPVAGLVFGQWWGWNKGGDVATAEQYGSPAFDPADAAGSWSGLWPAELPEQADVLRALKAASRRAWESAGQSESLAGFPFRTGHIGPPGVTSTRTGDREDELASLRRQVAEQGMILHDLFAEHPDYARGFVAGVAAVKERAGLLLSAQGREGLPCSEEEFYETAVTHGANVAFAACIRAMKFEPAGDAGA